MKKKIFCKECRDVVGSTGEMQRWHSLCFCKIDEALQPNIGNTISAFLTARGKFSSINILQRYVSVYRYGLLPPGKIFEKIAAAFTEYLANNGAKSLDQCFNLSHGRGKTLPFHEIKMEKQKELLCARIIALVGLGYSIDEAVLMVEKRSCKEKGNNKLPCTRYDSLRPNTLRTYYYNFIKKNKIWEKFLNSNVKNASSVQQLDFKKKFSKVTKQEVGKFVQSYTAGKPYP